jgi:indole-3-glycerol phosphate synthase
MAVLQLIEAREAGASGVMGIICQVSGLGTPVMSSFAASLGLDAPVEVVSTSELDFCIEKGVPMFALRCSVRRTLSVPGISSDIVVGLLGRMPLECASIVGVANLEEARMASMMGAAAVILQQAMLKDCCDDDVSCKQLIADVTYSMSGDD